MTMIADPPSRRRTSAPSAAQRLRTSFAASRVSFTWLGVRKTLSADQKAQAAQQFGAEGGYLSAAKKLVDTRDERFAAVAAVRHKIVSAWRAVSLPYPEPGVRLLKQTDIEGFDQQMHDYKMELAAAVQQLDAHYASLKAAARQRLGSLYNDADYPPSLDGLFAVNWDFPSVQPPEYLLRLNPALYEQERQRIAQRFDEAVRLATEAFTAEFSRLVSHLTERLAAGPDGQRKVFRDSAVTNLREFFDRFRSLNVGGNPDLERLVETAQRTVAGVDAQAVRDSDSLRQQVATRLSAVAASLDQLLVDQPRRRILRPAAQEA